MSNGKRLRVTITEDELTDGRVDDPLKCPLAIKLHEKTHRRVAVLREEIRFPNGQRYDLPTEARGFVKTVDSILPDTGEIPAPEANETALEAAREMLPLTVEIPATGGLP